MNARNVKVFAILHEPASYTVDRNRHVYRKLGVEYCYIQANSLALSDAREDDVPFPPLSQLSTIELAKVLSKILRENDIVIMNGYTGRVFRLLFLLNKRYRKVIGIDSDTPLNIPANPLKKLIKRLYLNTIFNDRKLWGLAGGNGSHRRLFTHYGMLQERVMLMPMMVDNSRFYCTTERRNHPFRFLYVGRVTRVKNIAVMIDAFLSKFSKADHVELRLVGKGEMDEELRARYGHAKNVIFAGPRYGAQLVDEYHQADVFVLPSSFEPWGLVVNEAMAAGLPVLVSNQVGAADDLVEGQDTGYIFDYKSTAELAELMARLVENPQLTRQLSQNAYRLMHDHWNYDLYESCLNRFITSASSCR